MKYNVVAGIRTKNEDWIIQKTLGCLQRFCSKIVIYDDQSDDETEKMCRSFDSVEWHQSAARDQTLWNQGQQSADLFGFIEQHNPDYILLLDADEIPTPSILDFFYNIDQNINLWKLRMVNLFDDEKHYRTDKYVSETGANINWDPFSANAWCKYPLVKYAPNLDYTYEPTRIGLGSVGPYHPSPNNVPTPHAMTDDFYIMHYGKISPSFTSGEKQRFYAECDAASGKGSYEERLRHHMCCSGLGGEEKTLVKCKEEWFWGD
jgi:glycosyltransferase involved in cell wall biosynthesis